MSLATIVILSEAKNLVFRGKMTKFVYNDY